MTSSTSSRTEEPAPETANGADNGSPPPEEKKKKEKEGEEKKEGDGGEDGAKDETSSSSSSSSDSDSDTDGADDAEGERPKRSHQNPEICKGNSKGNNVGLVCYLTEPDDDEVDEEDRWRSCYFCGRQYPVRW